VGLGLCLLTCGLQAQSDSLREKALQYFAPLPEPAVRSLAEIDLGRRLFYEKKLSLDESLNCQSCHNLEAFGDDGRRFSPGVGGKRGTRNSPTLYQAWRHTSQFWDGRRPDLESQAREPILNPVEMAMPSEAAVLERLRAEVGYQDLFARAFPGQAQPINLENLSKALAAFQRGLLTPAPWDRFLEGENSALNEDQKRGLETFLRAGCNHCHSGPALGGTRLERPPGLAPGQDRGVAELTGRSQDEYKFKVPGLRNVTQTAPYFHDGRHWNLEDALQEHAPRSLSQVQIKELIDFLGCLQGEMPLDYVRPPPSPEEEQAH